MKYTQEDVELIAKHHGETIRGVHPGMIGFYPRQLISFANAIAADAEGWISVNDALPDIEEGEVCSDEVLAGFWYYDSWLVEEKAHRFLFGTSMVIRNADLNEFPQGKEWLTFGPSHRQITHWKKVSPPIRPEKSHKGATP